MKEKNIIIAAAICLILAALTGFATVAEAQTQLPIKIHLWPGAERPDVETAITDILGQIQNPYDPTFATDSLNGSEFAVTTNIGQTLTAARNYGLAQGWNMDTCVHIITFPAGTFTNADGISRVGGYRGSGNSYNRSILLAQEPTNGQSGLDGIVKHEMIHNFGRDGHGYDGDCAGAPPYWSDKAMTKFVCGMGVDSTSILSMAAHCNIQLLTECSAFQVDCDQATFTLPRQFGCDQLILQTSTNGGQSWANIDTIAGNGTSFTQTSFTVTLSSQPENYSIWRLWQIDGDYQVGPVTTTTCLVLPLQLISFDGEAYEPAVNKLEWVTLNEENMVEFQLDYSDDAINFQTAMTVTATGDGTYVEYHELGRSGGIYYRLVSIDINGPCDTSDVIFINNTLTGTTESFPPKFSLYPNPASNIINANNWGNTATVKIYDATGGLVLSSTTMPIQVERLTRGFYTIHGYDNSNRITGMGKFIKQ